jgi:hypothetical protein
MALFSAAHGFLVLPPPICRGTASQDNVKPPVVLGMEGIPEERYRILRYLIAGRLRDPRRSFLLFATIARQD